MLWFNFARYAIRFFSLFLCMAIYDNKYVTKENIDCTNGKIIELQRIY